MKKIMYFAAALLVLVGCQSSQEARENAPAEMVTIKGRIELPQGPNKIAPQSDWNTKTEGENINFQWELGDEVAVIEMPVEGKMGDKGKMVYECKKFTVTSIDEEGTATLAGEALSSGMDMYLVVYPHIESTSNLEQASNAILLQQTYKKDSFKPIVSGIGNGNAFELNMFTPAIHLQLKGTVVLGKIEYRELDSGGDALIDSTAQMTFVGGLKLDNTTSTDVVLFVPKNEASHGFELSFYDTACQLIMKKKSKSESTSETALSQNTITPFPVLTVAEPFVPTYVDLGLPSGLKWATCNVGATTPEGYGDYFAWGETAPHPNNNYSWGSYKYCSNGDWTGMTKYTFPDNQENTNWYSWGSFIGDNKRTLDLADDAAAANWKGNWRMPTAEEFLELQNNCNHSWTTRNGVKGRLFTSKTNSDNYIFLPAAGFFNGTSPNYVGSGGYYWSSSLGTSTSSGGHYMSIYTTNMNNNWRYYGQSVRPVCQ